MKSLLQVLTCVALGGSLVVAGQVAPAPASMTVDVAVVSTANPSTKGWIVRKEDHVAGLSDPRHISRPGRLDYQQALEATSAWKEMKRKRIDPDSIEGRALRRKAATAVTRAAELVRQANGHCSMWKSVRHKDGRQIPDLTSSVISRL